MDVKFVCESGYVHAFAVLFYIPELQELCIWYMILMLMMLCPVVLERSLSAVEHERVPRSYHGEIPGFSHLEARHPSVQQARLYIVCLEEFASKTQSFFQEPRFWLCIPITVVGLFWFKPISMHFGTKLFISTCRNFSFLGWFKPYILGGDECVHQQS